MENEMDNEEMQNEEMENENENQNQSEEEENELMYIYEWVDSIQLSRPKKNISRDFCDCVLLAEIIKHYLPGKVDLHNYPSASSTKQKTQNWNTLNDKVLKKIGIKLSKSEINDVITCKQFAIEHLLQRVYAALQNKTKINDLKAEAQRKNKSKAEILAENNLEYLKKVLQEKENSIRQLHDIIEVLEMKVKSSNEMQKTLQDKVDELTKLLRGKGFNV